VRATIGGMGKTNKKPKKDFDRHYGAEFDKMDAVRVGKMVEASGVVEDDGDDLLERHMKKVEMRC
jgi:hypothetical protein